MAEVPFSTCYIESPALTKRPRYVQGQRVITPPHLHDGKRIIQVFDFNVHASRRHAHYNRLYRDDNTSVGLVCNKIVTHASHIPGGNLFKKPVVTRLPYHVVSREDSQAYSGFMIDEERIIGLKVTS